MAMEYYKITEGPYSDVVVVDGDFMYLSGLISEDLETGNQVIGDITTETRQTLNNLEKILKDHGSDMEHVVRVEVILHDFADRFDMNEEYVKHFHPDKMPARVCFGGVDLAGGCKIEIMVIARKAK
ncbi:MAG: RidA family protein [Firmicutes bacterium]|nr:RidA family protein [Bacillota bacterium]